MASSALANPLAMFCTSLLRHGYISQCLRDCVLVPLPKRNKDITCSQNYRPIALASTLSKILEHLICMKFAAFLSSSPLQFGFKAGSSTTLCTGMVKNVVSRFVRYLRGRIKAGTHGLSAVERAYGRLWSMADRTWQIEHRGEFRLALRRATSLPRGNKRDYVSYKTLVRWRFACALRGSARGFWFIDPLGLRPRGLCTVATRACHVNHAPPSYILIMVFVYLVVSWMRAKLLIW